MSNLNDYLNFVSSCIPTFNVQPTASVIQQINLARVKIALDTNCTRTVLNYTLTAGTPTYTFSTLFGSSIPLGIKEIWCWLGNVKYPLERKPIDYYFFTTTGYPIVYWQTGSSITFYPTPSSDYSVDIIYSYKPVNLVNNTDNDNDIPDVYQEAVGYLSSYYVALMDANTQLAGFYKQLANNALAGLNANRL